MSVTRSESAEQSRSPALRRRGAPPPHVLLVSDDPRWTVPVREAVAAQGGLVETVSARVAVARLSGIGTPVSHVLADRTDREGLLDTLAALTSDTASAEISLVFLGVPAFAHETYQVIRTASRQAVVASLRIRQFPLTPMEPWLTKAELWDVMARGLIEVRHQPIVRLSDRTVTAMEVLARLNHPKHGSLTPDWFIRRFEDTGLSFALTDRIVARALADRAADGLSGQGVAVALNYPLTVLCHPGAARNLDEKRADSGLAADKVVIELTESQPVEDFTALARSLETLRAFGYRVSIDDAGPAVKNLERLLDLPFTGLKLDKGIVRMLGAGGPLGAEVPRIVALALAKGLTIVAEGVETEDTWNRLRALGVQEAQGFFIARPLPAKAVPVWLEAWASAP